uniref:Uncharacterized protein n=1 Tax=Arundo donax TaxID=35708 RepID=A0A0A9HSQ2_ARUDO
MVAQTTISMVLENSIEQQCLLPPSLNQFEANHLAAKLQTFFPWNHTGT